MRKITIVLALLLFVIGANVFAQEAMDSVTLVPKENLAAIAPLISAQSYDALNECMVDVDGERGQVAVIDAGTSNVLAWGALEGVNYTYPSLKSFVVQKC